MRFEKQIKSLPSSQKIFHSAYTQYTQNNPISPKKGPKKIFFLQNLNIYAQQTTKKYKFQNQSPKNSHACVPLRQKTISRYCPFKHLKHGYKKQP